jgi:hypothetical protein
VSRVANQSIPFLASVCESFKLLCAGQQIIASDVGLEELLLHC